MREDTDLITLKRFNGFLFLLAQIIQCGILSKLLHSSAKLEVDLCYLINANITSYITNENIIDAIANMNITSKEEFKEACKD